MTDPERTQGASLFEQLTGAVARRSRMVRLTIPPFDPLRLALIIVAIIPAGTLLAGALIALRLGYSNRTLARTMAPRIAGFAAARSAERLRAAVAPLLTVPTLSDVVMRLSEKLPPDAHVHAMAIDRDGGLTVQLDCNDPEIVMAAIKPDPLLGSLRMVGQSPARQGVRITLRRPDR